MLSNIIAIALRYKVLVLVGFVLVIVMGVKAWIELPVDAFPEVTPIQVNIYTESPGLAAEDIEQLLTTPIETAMAGLAGVEMIRSISLFGLSYVSVNFYDDVDIYFARRLVGEKLIEAKDLIPAGYGEPVMGPNSSGLGQVFWYAIESPDAQLSIMDLRTIQDWNIRLKLLTASGVDDVTSWGGDQKQLQVLINPNKLIQYNLSLSAVMDSIAANNRQVAGQFLNIGQEQYLVRGLGLVTNTNDIGNIVITTRNGTPIYVNDIATVVEGAGLRTGAVTKDGKEVVIGMALQRLGENAKSVVEAVKEKIKIIEQSLPKGAAIVPIYDRTDLVDKAVGTAESALIEGSILVALILYLFLGEIRSAIVVIVVLPLAMLISFMFMKYVGLTANLMSLAGLAVGIGMMVDGAVVMVENCFRLLAHHRDPKTGKVANKTALILEASSDVITPVAFAILIIIVVFLPLFSLTGLEGKMFKPMAYSISFAMIGSFLLTLTLVPVLAVLILKAKEEKDTFIVRKAKQIYLPILNWTLNHKKKVALSAATCLIACFALIPFLGKEFMPTLQEGAILFRVTSIPSTSLDESIRISELLENKLKTFPETASSIALIGRAEKGETSDVNTMELLVNLTPTNQWKKKITVPELARQMQVELEKTVPTAVISATQPIESRIEELISGVRSTLALKVVGEDLTALDSLSADIKHILEGVKGVADLSLEANQGKPQLVIRVNRDAAARYGINAADILDIVQSGIGGKAVSTVIDGNKRIDIQVWLAAEFRNSVAAIAAIPIQTNSGALVPLSAVANIELEEGYSFIRREQLQRYAIIQMDVQGRDVDSFVNDAVAQIKQKITLPEGYVLEWGGAFENQQRAMAKLAVIIPLTIALIFILLYTTFNSLSYATLIIANVPFASIGGILGLFITGQLLSVPSAIGFIAVFGVAMLNGIVLISFLNEQLKTGMPLREAVREGALLRLRPVLMTASIAIVGLLPMLLSSGVGAETQRPLATVVVGGLFTSTALTLLLLPMLYEWVENRKAQKLREAK